MIKVETVGISDDRRVTRGTSAHASSLPGDLPHVAPTVTFTDTESSLPSLLSGHGSVAGEHPHQANHLLSAGTGSAGLPISGRPGLRRLDGDLVLDAMWKETWPMMSPQHW
ncbi:MAG: hypothetical protein BWY66_01104 [bacterium ADurb.Bin374]|nr:MAG: hypothetical protein BWY66_01104 [bacterium ADurb.Bin374]